MIPIKMPIIRYIEKSEKLKTINITLSNMDFTSTVNEVVTSHNTFTILLN